MIENSAMNELLSSKSSMDIEPDTNQNLLIPRQKLQYWIASTLDSSADGNSNCIIFITHSKLNSLAQSKTFMFKTCITFTYPPKQPHHSLFCDETVYSL